MVCDAKNIDNQIKIFIKSSIHGITLKQLVKEFNIQTGKKFIIAKDLLNYTVEIDLNNITLEKALNKIADKYNNYKPLPKTRIEMKNFLTIIRENDTYIIGKKQPAVTEREIYYNHELKHIPYEALKNILLTSIPDSSQSIKITYIENNNIISINSIDESIYPQIQQIIEKYDVEIIPKATHY